MSTIARRRTVMHNFRNTAMQFFKVIITHSLFYNYLFHVQLISIGWHIDDDNYGDGRQRQWRWQWRDGIRRRWRRHDGDGATGDEVNDDGDGTMSNDDVAMAWRVTKLTMMETTTTLATGSNDDGDSNGATGDTSMATARRATKTTMMAAVDQ